MPLIIDHKAYQWLSRKFLLFSIGIYATLAGIIGISWISISLGVRAPINTFIAFLLTIFARTFYEQLVILDIPRTSLQPSKNALFALVYALIMSFVYYTIRASLGYLGIPIAMVIAQAVIKPVKAYLFPAKPRSAIYELYAQKQGSFMASLYGFYGLLALLAITGVQYLHLPFVVAFGSAVFIALMASVIFELHYLYTQPLTLKSIVYWKLIALFLAVVTTSSFMAAIKILGMSGQTATIICCVAVKIVEQYLVSFSLKK